MGTQLKKDGKNKLKEYGERKYGTLSEVGKLKVNGKSSCKETERQIEGICSKMAN